MRLGGNGGIRLSVAVFLLAVTVSSCASKAPEAKAPSALPRSETATFFSSMSENVDKYRILIGLKRSGIEQMFNEVPKDLREDGIEFENAGIRIWFDTTSGRAVRVMMISKAIDFNGAKIGDTEQAFDAAFGKATGIYPESGYKDYAYEDLVLRLYYDAASGKTEAVSLMLEAPEGSDKP